MVGIGVVADLLVAELELDLDPAAGYRPCAWPCASPGGTGAAARATCLHPTTGKKARGVDCPKRLGPAGFVVRPAGNWHLPGCPRLRRDSGRASRAAGPIVGHRLGER